MTTVYRESVDSIEGNNGETIAAIRVEGKGAIPVRDGYVSVHPFLVERFENDEWTAWYQIYGYRRSHGRR